MSKVYVGAQRRDSLEDHVHALPNGKMTGGMLAKPSKDQFHMHSHLYEIDEEVMETSIARDGSDHEHSTELGDTSGPKPMSKEPGAPWKSVI